MAKKESEYPTLEEVDDEDVYEAEVEFVPEDEIDNETYNLSYEETIELIEGHLIKQGYDPLMVNLQARKLFHQYYDPNTTIH